MRPDDCFDLIYVISLYPEVSGGFFSFSSPGKKEILEPYGIIDKSHSFPDPFIECIRFLQHLGILLGERDDMPDEWDVVRRVRHDFQLARYTTVLLVAVDFPQALEELDVVVEQQLAAARLHPDGCRAPEWVRAARDPRVVDVAMRRVDAAAPGAEPLGDVVGLVVGRARELRRVERQRRVDPGRPHPGAGGRGDVELLAVDGDVAQQPVDDVAARAVTGEDDAARGDAVGAQEVEIGRHRVLQSSGEARLAGGAGQPVLRAEDVRDGGRVLEHVAGEVAAVALAPVAQHEGAAVEVEDDGFVGGGGRAVGRAVGGRGCVRLRVPRPADFGWLRLLIGERSAVHGGFGGGHDDEAVAFAARGHREWDVDLDLSAVVDNGAEETRPHGLPVRPFGLGAEGRKDIDKHPEGYADAFKKDGIEGVRGLKGVASECG